MKKLSWITGILTGVMVLLAALGAVCGAIDQIATDENFYGGMSRTAVAKYLDAENDPQISAKVTEYIGLTDAEQDEFAKEMAAFMAGETDAQPDVLNEKEQQHMRDVRGLTQAAAGISKTYLTLAVALAVVTAWTGAKLKRRVLPRLIGGLSAVTVIMIIVQNIMNQVTAGGFEMLFVQMHEAIFTNDLWLMDPNTDILIRMMPQPLFEQALLNGANQALRMFLVVWVMLLVVYEIVSRMIRRHVAKGE
ncbi:MAG: DUF1461 domain-containing protein [Clostridiales bacterium]|nr:DUF1461 domain-containing protein [Clostridiales bacterium]